MAAVASLFVRIGANVQGLSNGLKKSEKRLKRFQYKTRRVSENFKTIGTNATIAGAGVALGLGMAVKTAADFQQQMDRVGALSQASEAQMLRMTETAKELGSTTSFSASQAAKGMQFLAMAGYETNEIIDAMPGLLNAAAAGQTDLATTADITSNILSGFGIAAKDTAKVADVLTKTFTSSNTDMQMLGETMKFVAPVAKSAGQSLEEMAAATGILGNAGIQGSKAGTALRATLIRLADPPKEAAEQLDKLGLNIANASGKVKPLSQIVGELNQKTKGMSQAQKLAAVSTITGTEAASAMLALMDSGQSSIQKFRGELQKSGGTAQSIADQQLSNLNGSLTKLKSGLEGAAISIGTALTPAVQVLVGFLQSIVDWFNQLSPAVQSTIAVAAALTATFLLVGGALLFVIGFIPQIVTGIGMMSGVLATLTGPIGLTIAGIFALGAALVIAYKKSETFRNIVNQAWEKVKQGFQAFLGFIKPALVAMATFFIGQFNKIKTWWFETWPVLQKAFMNIWNGIWAFLKPIINAIVSIMKWAWPFIKLLIVDTWNIIKGVISNALNIIMNVISAFANLFTGNWSGLWENIKEIIGSALKLVWYFLQVYLIGKALKIFKFFGDELMRVGRYVWAEVKSFFKDGVSWAVRKLDDLTKGVREKFSSILSWIRGLGRKFYDAGKGLIDMMKKGIENAANRVIGAVQRIAGKVRDFLPFSPAKDGPLSDLDKLDFAGPIEKSIMKGLPSVQASMTHMLQPPQISSGPIPVTSSTRNNQPVTIIVTLDSREIARGTAPHLTREIRIATGGAI
jgi:TP901 family phage tail tape measure protein